MVAQFALLRGARRWWLAVIGTVLVVALLAVLSSGGGSSSPSAAAAASGPVSTASLATFRQAIISRMHAQQLNYTGVACVHSGGRFQGVPVVRCNVDFGIDPHVMAYCSVFRGGQLLTSEQDPAIPCGHDNAGYSGKLITYG